MADRSIPPGVLIIAVGTAALAGALAMAIVFGIAQMPGWCSETQAGPQCIQGWLEALGGWVGGLIAIPTLYLLIGQTKASQRQAAAGFAPIVGARIEALQAELDSNNDLARRVVNIVDSGHRAARNKHEDSISIAMETSDYCTQNLSPIVLDRAFKAEKAKIPFFAPLREQINEALFQLEIGFRNAAAQARDLRSDYLADRDLYDPKRTRSLIFQIAETSSLDGLRVAISAANRRLSEEIAREAERLETIHEHH